MDRQGLVPGAGLEPAWPKPRDFKSLVSTSFTTRAAAGGGSPLGGCSDAVSGAKTAGSAEGDLEAEVGIEPASTALQAAA